MADIFTFNSSCEFLKHLYEEKKRRNRSFSHRYIGLKIGFSAGYFSRIVSGEKPLSSKMVEKFIGFFNLKPREADYFRNLVGYSQSCNVDQKKVHYQKMLSLRKNSSIQTEKLHFEFFAHWSHSAVFSLCRVEPLSENSDFAVIGKRFTPKLSSEEIRKSLDLLQKLGLIKLTDSGTFEVIHSFLSSIGDESMNIRNYLANSINGAVIALDQIPREQREIQTMMLTVSELGYQKIKSKIETLRKEINEIVAEDSGIDRICQANFHLFPRYTK